MGPMVRPGGLVVLAFALGGCNVDRLPTCDGVALGAGGHAECAVPGWVDRAFELDVPASWDGTSPLPVIVLFHGGGGSRQGANRSTCPGGDEADAGCLREVAARRGYALVVPDGTGQRPLRNVRTWNGGGGNELQCTSGPACKSRVDDIGYVLDLLAEVKAAVPVDDGRVYATGISNGGAMSHRVACELPGTFAAIVGVAGANQFADDGGPCAAQVPVRQIHGTLDPCWAYDGGTAACAQDDGGAKTSVAATMEGWRTRNGCAATFADVPRADRDPADTTQLVIRTWAGCAAPTELFVVDGGGHTWPSGWAYLDASRIGAVSFEVDNDDVVDFFDANAR